LKLEFSGQIFKKILKYKILMKISPVVAELFHAERRTDRHMMKLMAAFCNFAKATKN